MSGVGAPSTRFGAIVPSVNRVIEPLYSRALPEDIALHTTRVFLDAALTDAALAAMSERVAEAGRNIASCHPHVVLYLCTASAFAGDPEHEDETMRNLAEIVGVPVVTVFESIVDGCRAVGATKVALVSPYPDAMEHAEIEALAEHGLDTVGHASLGIGDAYELATPDADAIVAAADAAWTDEAEAILMTCANFRSHEVVSRLEAKYDRPVVTSTLAPLWRALRTAGFDTRLADYGRLFDRAG